jgi:hypothetical protein
MVAARNPFADEFIIARQRGVGLRDDVFVFRVMERKLICRDNGMIARGPAQPFGQLGVGASLLGDLFWFSDR